MAQVSCLALGSASALGLAGCCSGRRQLLEEVIIELPFEGQTINEKHSDILWTTETFSSFCRQPESSDTMLWMHVCALCQLTEAAAATRLHFRGSSFLWAEKIPGTRLMIHFLFHSCFHRTVSKGHDPEQPRVWTGYSEGEVCI